MGQRFQIVIKVPEKYWNENNCNNHSGKLLAYHCQWMWGNFSIWRMGNLVKGINELVEQEKESKRERKGAWGTDSPIDYEEIINKTIKWVCHKDLKSQNSIYSYFGKDNEGFKFDEKHPDWKTLFNSFDNNNGIFFLEISKTGKLKYCFYNPSENEGSNYEKILDWKTYLKDYAGEKQEVWDEDTDYQSSVKVFENTPVIKSFPKIESWMVEKKEQVE